MNFISDSNASSTTSSPIKIPNYWDDATRSPYLQPKDLGISTHDFWSNPSSLVTNERTIINPLIKQNHQLISTASQSDRSPSNTEPNNDSITFIDDAGKRPFYNASTKQNQPGLVSSDNIVDSANQDFLLNFDQTDVHQESDSSIIFLNLIATSTPKRKRIVDYARVDGPPNKKIYSVKKLNLYNQLYGNSSDHTARSSLLLLSPVIPDVPSLPLNSNQVSSKRKLSPNKNYLRPTKASLNKRRLPLSKARAL